MNNCPLNDELLGRMFADEVSKTELQALKKHLEDDCSCCEKFFAALDEDTEKAFLGFIYAAFNESPQPDILDNESKMRIFENIDAKLENSKLPSAENSKVFRLPSWTAMPIAASIILLSSLVVFQLTQDKTPLVPITKSGDVIIDGNIYLQFSTLAESDSFNEKPKPVSGKILGEYLQTDGLIFRYEINAPGYVYIFRASGDGGIEIIFPDSGSEQSISETGAHFLKTGDNIFLSKLSGLSGAQTFCAVVSRNQNDDVSTLINKSKNMFDSEKSRFSSGRLRADGMDCFQITVLE